MKGEQSPALDVEGLVVSFGGVRAVDEFDLTIAAGETIGLVGGSGVGKSTVARAVAGLVTPDSGAIRLDGVDLVGLRRRAARRQRRRLHLVSQDPYAALPPTLRVLDIVAEPLVIHRIGDRKEHRERAADALNAVNLHPRHLTRYPHQLSGGERQRVAFARALVTEPRLVLADEPTRMLDATLRRDIVDLISELAVTKGVAILHITHDLVLVGHGCARVAVMRRGRVVEHGRTTEVFDAPAHPYTAALIAAAQRTRAKQ
ncbi:ABC transporter ATP-binding protein [Mycobacterium sp. SMC-8]|uniref:ABC transporter ATP-binding protein n=1 Tax=Mycobacterium sp. SMC-8 TaxID=2857060 RepID=UPI0021B35043|nr:ABC transporter ATP-binding protein [Mycobacterium sp. SMC-8]UXA13568.1 ABC transporter ATP-binding protein [Mycobacterium sp. SMC-8]